MKTNQPKDAPLEESIEINMTKGKAWLSASAENDYTEAQIAVGYYSNCPEWFSLDSCHYMVHWRRMLQKD